jgi:uncharacterized membrane protein YcaP (DUF421 family)
MRKLSSSLEELSLSTIIHAVFGYLFLLLIVRVLSRRPGGQLTLFEFVIVFLIGGVIILSTVGKDRSVTNCATAILTVGLMHWMVSGIKGKYPRLGAIVDGTPLTLLKNGEWQLEVMKGMRIDREDVMAAARTKGLSSIHDVAYAILERNGAISIIKNEN